jgi:hypothetical protein
MKTKIPFYTGNRTPKSEARVRNRSFNRGKELNDIAHAKRQVKGWNADGDTFELELEEESLHTALKDLANEANRTKKKWR